MDCVSLCLAFARQFMIDQEHPGDCLLNFVKGQKHIDGLPSWCPDLSVSRSPMPLSRQGYWSNMIRDISSDKTQGFSARFDLSSEIWSPKKRATGFRDMFALGLNKRPDHYEQSGPKQMWMIEPPEGSMDLFKRRLQVTGLRVGTVATVLPFPSADASVQNVLKWERECFQVFQGSRKDFHGLDSYCRTLVAQPAQAKMELMDVEKKRLSRWTRKEPRRPPRVVALQRRPQHRQIALELTLRLSKYSSRTPWVGEPVLCQTASVLPSLVVDCRS